MKIKKGDKVLVIAGKDRNKVGTVEKVLTKDQRVVVSGLNMVKKHLKRDKENPQGGIIDKMMPMSISNVMMLDANNKPTRVGYRVSGQQKVRFSKTTGDALTKEGK